jgi:hypothetical protein
VPPDTGDGRPVLRWAVLGVVAAGVSAGTVAYATSPDADLAAVPALRQLDLFYLDEPAPALDELGVEPGRVAVVVFCDPPCPRPDVSGAQVVRSSDPDLAARYALFTSEGRIGPGYALVDPSGRLRYRTFDPDPGAHGGEVQVLVDALADAGTDGP